MKKKRGLFVILAGVVLLCVLIVCYFALLKANSSEEETTEEETTQEEVAAIASDDISTLTFEAGDQTVTFQKAEDSWTLEGQEDFPVDASKVDSILSGIRQSGSYPDRCGGSGRIRSGRSDQCDRGGKNRRKQRKDYSW